MRFSRHLPLLAGLIGTPSLPVFADLDNSYVAAPCSQPPVIDGKIDSIWNSAVWDSIRYTWIGPAVPASDFSGRYKVLWSTDRLHLLVEITDDSLSDRHADPLQSWWNDDALEIFLDENRDGGDHQFNFSAWAYHISRFFDAVDYGPDEQPHLFNDHFKVALGRSGNVWTWELEMAVYGSAYSLEGPNTSLSLHAGKEMGFTLAYCDNDGRLSRDNFFGSVNTPQHLANEGYLNADGFGRLVLGEDTSTGSSKRSSPAVSPWKAQAGGITVTSSRWLRLRSLSGKEVRRWRAQPGITYGHDLAPGSYLVDDPSAVGVGVFLKPH
ncbi:MAG: CBM9 family sugar-binding protein [Fibrobacteria bacterium]|nr:CBM9 family sugar-binding protein [Fibrobacteria bacterium]